MQCLRSSARTFAVSSVRSFASTASRLTSSSLPVSSTSPPKILLKPLPHASLDRFASNFFAPSKQDSRHYCADFTLILKPYPRHLTGKDGNVDEAKFVPHWLPMPPRPSTHQGRHFRSPLYTTPPSEEKSEGAGDGERWEAGPKVPFAASTGEPRPVLRLFVMSTKKRIHKYAVLRHRVRTRLTAALRTALFDHPDLLPHLNHQRNVLMLIASPSAYSRPHSELVQEMEKALRIVTRRSASSQPAHKKRS